MRHALAVLTALLLAPRVALPRPPVGNGVRTDLRTGWAVPVEAMG